jgi:hypothetical protein
VLLRAVDSAYSGGAATSFASNDFESELEIGLAARALEIVKQRWLSVRRRLGEAYIAGDDRLVDFVAHIRAHVRNDLPARLLRGSYMVNTTP